MAGAHQLVHFLGLKGGVAERIGSGVSSRKEINTFGPQEGLTPALIPIVRMGVREEVCHSSPPPPLSALSLSSHSYHTVGSFLSLRGASSALSRGLCRLFFLQRLQDTMMMRKRTTAAMPPPTAKASRRRSEKEAGGKEVPWEDRNMDAWQQSHNLPKICQTEFVFELMWSFFFVFLCYYFSSKLRLQTCGDHAEPDLSTRAMNIRRILHLANVGAVIGEFDLLNDDGGVAAHHVSSPEDALPEDAIRWRIRPLLVVEHLKR